jgi:tRNA threonylcarbamoyladenosine biosynthesis protein TsaB
MLAVATATAQVSVAMGGPDGLIGSLTLRQGRRHGETLAPAIESLGRLAGVPLRRMDRIAVDTGPGLFTGLRVGVATAKALGAALDRPVVACSSLDALAWPHRRSGRLVASVVDARRREVFWALYESRPDRSACDPVMVALTEPAVVDPDGLRSELAGLRRPVLATGDGARRYLTNDGPGVPFVEVAPAGFDHPSAVVLLTLADMRPALSAEKVAPLYLRPPDVRIGWEQM